MKIYEIGTGYTPIPAQMGAATEIVVEELTHALQELSEDVEILDIKAKNRQKNNLPIREVSVPSFIMKEDVSLGLMHKVKRVLYSVCLAGVLKKILKKTDEKVVLHFHNQYNVYFFQKLVPRRLRDKAIKLYTNHSYVWHGDWNEIKETINNRYFQEVSAMKEADFVFVLNSRTKENIINHIGISEDKVILIDNGVNTQVYHKLAADELEKVKTKYNLNGKTVFVQVGSVCDRKNQMGSIRLLLPFLKENENTVFIYAGGIISEEYQQEIENFAKSEGISDQIRYFGELTPGKQLNELYNLASAMVFPSKAEGFSLVILEAMSAGVPVLVYDTLLFKLSGDCIRFSGEKDFAHIVNEQILKADPAELSEKVRTAVVENYSWMKVAKDYLSVVEH